MASSTAEEVEALEAIYCEHEEFKLHQLGDGDDIATILTVRVRNDEPHSKTCDTTFTLKTDYPLCVPDISLSCPSLSRTETASLKAELESYADTLIGQPMLLMLTLWTKEHLDNFTVGMTEDQATNDGCFTHRTVLLNVDHMRAKVRYTKTVCQWVEELGLSGRLICHERLILILIEGPQDAVKEYLIRHRTVAIDVDSKGRSCKERMMSVLMDVPVHNTMQRFTDFKVTQLLKATELEELFVKNGLTLEYQVHILPLMKRQ